MNPKKQKLYSIIALVLAVLMVSGSVTGILYALL
jgi:hypothetical protein